MYDDDDDASCYKNKNNTLITIQPSTLMTLPLGFSQTGFWGNTGVLGVPSRVMQDFEDALFIL